MILKNNLHKFFWFVGIGFAILMTTPQNANAQFYDDFSSPTLDPAWTVVQTWTGGTPRSYGFTQPGNHYSLTDNPGYLRYWFDPMTHYDGFLNGYETVPGNFYSCCIHDAGLEILRSFSGDKWRFEAGGNFQLPYSNGRYFSIHLYFGNGGVPTYWVQLRRGADVSGNLIDLGLIQKTGPLLSEQTNLEYLNPNGSWYYGDYNYPTAPMYFRVERDGGLLTASWSDDGEIWNIAWSHDLGTALDGLEQRVAFGGLCWFVPAGSYADWDYASVIPTVTPVVIDIMPGMSPNYINSKSKGVIPVAILTDAGFDATTVNPLSVEFGPNGANAKDGKGHIKDVDADGDLDMVLQFNTSETGIQCGETEASLTGMTINSLDIKGTDAIMTVPCNLKSANIEQAQATLPIGYSLYQNYPNPFNTETEIRFCLPENNHAQINIFNIHGEIIRTLVNMEYSRGEHNTRWDGTDNSGKPVSDGIYLYQLKTDTFTKVGKMSLIR